MNEFSHAIPSYITWISARKTTASMRKKKNSSSLVMVDC